MNGTMNKLRRGNVTGLVAVFCVLSTLRKAKVLTGATRNAITTPSGTLKGNLEFEVLP